MTLEKPTPSARPLLSEVADVYGCSTGYLTLQTQHSLARITVIADEKMSEIAGVKLTHPMARTIAKSSSTRSW